MVEASEQTKKIDTENAEESKEEVKLTPDKMFKDYKAEDIYIKMPSEHNPITPEEQWAINKKLREIEQDKRDKGEGQELQNKNFNNQDRMHTFVKNGSQGGNPYSEIEKKLCWGPVTDVKPLDLRFDDEIRNEVKGVHKDEKSIEFRDAFNAQLKARDEQEKEEVRKKSEAELRAINREVRLHMDRWQGMLEFERRVWLDVSNENEHNRIAGLINVNKGSKQDEESKIEQVDILQNLEKERTCDTVGAEINGMNWVLRDYKWFARKKYVDGDITNPEEV